MSGCAVGRRMADLTLEINAAGLAPRATMGTSINSRSVSSFPAAVLVEADREADAQTHTLRPLVFR